MSVDILVMLKKNHFYFLDCAEIEIRSVYRSLCSVAQESSLKQEGRLSGGTAQDVLRGREGGGLRRAPGGCLLEGVAAAGARVDRFEVLTETEGR